MKVNGEKIKTPQKLEVSLSDIDKDSYRTAAGITVRNRVASGKRKLVMSWGGLRNEEISKLLKAVKAKFFECTYPDPEEGKEITKTFYVGDRTAPIYTKRGDLVIWEGLKMDFVEK